MVDALNEAKDSDPKGILMHMKDKVNEFVGEASQFDDLTMMCVMWNGDDASA